MRSWIAASVLALASITVGCAANPAPVPLAADARGRQLLTGDWVGEYFNHEGGRAGSISFSLVPHDTTNCGGHGEHAHGDVLMVPRGSSEALKPELINGANPAPEAPQVLTIDFIRVTGNQVTGTLTPFRDPQCQCVLSTTFQGRIEGDKITGSLVTVVSKTGEREVGTWEVTRRRR